MLQKYDLKHLLLRAHFSPALFTNLDLGTYWVYELDAENHPIKNGGTLALENRSYTVSEAAPSVTLDEGGDAETVEITNAREEGSLKITKQVTVGDNAWTDATKASPVDGSYVFGVYADANCTEPATDANGAAVAACQMGKWGYHVPRIHTRRDVICEESNLQYVTACAVKLTEFVNKGVES